MGPRAIMGQCWESIPFVLPYASWLVKYSFVDFNSILNENQLNGNIPDSLGLVRTLEVM